MCEIILSSCTTSQQLVFIDRLRKSPQGGGGGAKDPTVAYILIYIIKGMSQLRTN